MSLTLPWPPTTNNLYATVGRRRVKSAEGKRFDLRVKLVIWSKFDHKRPDEAWPMDGPYRVVVTLHAPRRFRYDVENRSKALMDSLFAAIGQDDSLIDDLRLVRGNVDRGNPRAEVVVEEVNHDAA